MSDDTEESSTVDESAIRRQSIMGGMWDGMRKGAIVGGIVMAGLVGAGAFVGLAVAGKMMSMPAALGSLGGLAGPKGMLIGGVLGTVATAAGMFVGAGFLPSMLAIGGTALAVIGGAAAIGALVGAVNGYGKADQAVEAAQDAEIMAHERQHMAERQAIQKDKQLSLAEARLAAERERLHASAMGNAPAIPSSLPNLNVGPGKSSGRGSAGFPGN